MKDKIKGQMEKHMIFLKAIRNSPISCQQSSSQLSEDKDKDKDKEYDFYKDTLENYAEDLTDNITLENIEAFMTNVFRSLMNEKKCKFRDEDIPDRCFAPVVSITDDISSKDLKKAIKLLRILETAGIPYLLSGRVAFDILKQKHDFLEGEHRKYLEFNLFNAFCEDFIKLLQYLDLNFTRNKINGNKCAEKESIFYTNVLRTTAWLFYRILLTDHFFKDGCVRVASALVYMVLQKYEFPEFPAIAAEETWKDIMKKYAPDQYREEKNFLEREKKNNGNIVSVFNNDPIFDKWYGFYRNKLFSHALDTLNSFGVIDRFPSDAWNIQVKNTLSEGIVETIKNKANIKTFGSYEPDFGKDNIFGSYREAVFFTPERVLLHELIMQLILNYQLDEKKSNEIITYIIKCKEYTTLENIFKGDMNKKSSEEWDAFTMSGPLYSSDLHACELRSVVNEVHQKLANISPELYSSDPADKKAYIQQLVKHMILQRRSEELAQEKIKGFLENINDILERINYALSKLSKKENWSRKVWVVVGGPASGKSSLIRKEIQQEFDVEWLDICKLNSDYFRFLLLSKDERDSKDKTAAAKTHHESSIIMQRMMERIKTDFIQKNECPDILFDVTKPSDDKLELAKLGGATVILFATACPIDIAIYRAFNRGQYGTVDYYAKSAVISDSEKTPAEHTSDKGRFVPTKEIIKTYRDFALHLIKMSPHKPHFLRIFNTFKVYQQSHNEIANIDIFADELLVLDVQGLLHILRSTNVKDLGDGSLEEDYYEQLVKNTTVENDIKLLLQLADKNQEIAVGFKLSKEDDYYAYINIRRRQIIIVDIDKLLYGFSISREALNNVISIFCNYIIQEGSHKNESLEVVIHNGTWQEKVFVFDKDKGDNKNYFNDAWGHKMNINLSYIGLPQNYRKEKDSLATPGPGEGKETFEVDQQEKTLMTNQDQNIKSTSPKFFQPSKGENHVNINQNEVDVVLPDNKQALRGGSPKNRKLSETSLS